MSTGSTPPVNSGTSELQRLATFEAHKAAAAQATPVAASPAYQDKPGVIDRDTLQEQAPELAGAYDQYAGADGELSHEEFEQLYAALKGPTDPDTAMLESLYQEHLGRSPDGQGLAVWGQQMKEMRAAGKSDAEIKALMTPKITGSPEYQRLHPEKAAATAPVARTGSATTTAPGAAPFISQFAPDGAENGYTNGSSNCGPTSMASIVRAFGGGEGLTDAQLINQLGAAGGTGEAGTGVDNVGVMARSAGLNAEVRYGTDTDWIADQIDAGKMVVANGDYYSMAPHENAAKKGQGGHYIAVVGKDASGNFLVNDPADQPGGTKTVSPGELARFMNSRQGGGNMISVGSDQPRPTAGTAGA